MDYQQLLSLLESRRTVRRFTDQSVSRDTILKLIEAARWAPSNHNRQGWRFLVYDDRPEIRALARRVEAALSERVKKLPATAAAYASPLVRYAVVFAEAPVLIIALHKRPVSVSAPLLEGVPDAALVSGEPLSTSMAVQNLLLAAHTLGLGTCVMTGPLLVPAVLAGLELPPGYEVTCLVALGDPAESPAAPRRKELDQIVEFRDHPEVPAKL